MKSTEKRSKHNEPASAWKSADEIFMLALFSLRFILGAISPRELTTLSSWSFLLLLDYHCILLLLQCPHLSAPPPPSDNSTKTWFGTWRSECTKIAHRRSLAIFTADEVSEGISAVGIYFSLLWWQREWPFDEGPPQIWNTFAEQVRDIIQRMADNATPIQEVINQSGTVTSQYMAEQSTQLSAGLLNRTRPATIVQDGMRHVFIPCLLS